MKELKTFYRLNNVFILNLVGTAAFNQNGGELLNLLLGTTEGSELNIIGVNSV